MCIRDSCILDCEEGSLTVSIGDKVYGKIIDNLKGRELAFAVTFGPKVVAEMNYFGSCKEISLVELARIAALKAIDKNVKMDERFDFIQGLAVSKVVKRYLLLDDRALHCQAREFNVPIEEPVDPNNNDVTASGACFLTEDRRISEVT